jgi:hypothetical protein
MLWLGLFGSAAVALTLFAAVWADPVREWLFPPPPVNREDRTFDITLPGIECPPAVPAAGASTADDEPVIGVTAGGHSRAYLVRAMEGPTSHVVNDVLGGVPVSVTHCDIHHCTRAFTADSPGVPLSLAQGGLRDRGMVLRSGGYTYRQDSGAAFEPDGPPFPYASFPVEESTWGAWRKAHPDTDLYTGPLALSADGESPPPGDPPLPPPPDRVARPAGLAASFPWLIFVALSAVPFLCALTAVFVRAVLSHVRGRPTARNDGDCNY